jgi:hypothetical protein
LGIIGVFVDRKLGPFCLQGEMMRKDILWVLVCVFSFSLLGCGGGDGPPVTETPSNKDPSDMVKDGIPKKKKR